jgi:hypothetical protein
VEPQRVGSNSNGGRQGLPAESDKNSKDVSDGKRRHGLFTILLPGARRNPLRFILCQQS